MQCNQVAHPTNLTPPGHPLVVVVESDTTSVHQCVAGVWYAVPIQRIAVNLMCIIDVIIACVI